MMDFQGISPDIPLKQFWRDNERFAALFNDMLFNGNDYVKPESLTEMDTEVSAPIITKRFQHMLKRTRDIVKMSSDGTAYQILGIENQQAIHYAMPLRTLTYETLSYIRQVDDRTKELRKTKEYSNTGEFLSGWKKDDKLKPCYTIVIYWGEGRWDGPRSLADMMEFDAACKISDKFRDYPAMHLICVNEFDAHSLERLRHEEVHEVFDKVSSVYQKDIEDLSETLSNVSIDVAYVVAAATGTMSQFGTVLKEAQESGKESVNMRGAFGRALEKERREGEREGERNGKQEGILEGERNGKQEGILEGERNGKKIPSLNMLKKGFDYKMVAEISEVSVDQVKAWEKENASPS